MAVDVSLTALLGEVAELTDYASAFRYPDAAYEPDAFEATEALATAKRLCDEIEWRIGSDWLPNC